MTKVLITATHGFPAIFHRCQIEHLSGLMVVVVGGGGGVGGVVMVVVVGGRGRRGG